MLSDAAEAAAAAAALVKEVETLFPSEYLLLLCDDELGFAQACRGGTARQLYAVYAGDVPELTVVPAMLQISDYLGDGMKMPAPEPMTAKQRQKESPSAPLLIADGTVLVQPCEIGNFIAMVGKGSPRNVALVSQHKGLGLYKYPSDPAAGQSYEVLYCAPEWRDFARILTEQLPGSLQLTLTNARCCIG